MVEQTANDGDASVCDRSLITKELESVSDTFGADSSHNDMNLDHLLKLDRIAIVAFGIDPEN